MSTEIEKLFLPELQKYRWRYSMRAANRGEIIDGEDVFQEVYLLIVSKERKNPGWWESLKNNKEAYFNGVARNVKHMMLRKSNYLHNISIANFEVSLPDLLSDNGDSIAKSNHEIDQEEFLLKLRPAIKDFSSYEMELLELIMLDGYKPREIAKILNQPYEKISMDCNRVKAKLRARVKSKIRNLR
jgi:RNA polymerase sigma factor (sigma-70 family)